MCESVMRTARRTKRKNFNSKRCLVRCLCNWKMSLAMEEVNVKTRAIFTTIECERSLTLPLLKDYQVIPKCAKDSLDTTHDGSYTKPMKSSQIGWDKSTPEPR